MKRILCHPTLSLPIALGVLMLSPPLSAGLNAQAPVRYQFVTTRPALGVRTDSGKSVNTVVAQRTTAPVTLLTFDSAGGTVFHFVVDSSRHEYFALDASWDTKQRLDKLKALPPAQFPEVGAAMAYQVLVQKGRAVTWSTSRPGSDVRRVSALDDRNPTAALLGKIPGIGLLVTNPNLPTVVGAVRADTFINDRTPSNGSGGPQRIPAGLGSPPQIAIYDTLVMVWKRVSTDTVVAQVTQHTTNVNDGALAPNANNPSPPTVRIGVTTGFHQIVFDSKGIRSATTSLTSKARSTPVGSSPGAWSDSTSTKYSIVRVP